MVENIQYSSGTITYKQGTNASLGIRLKTSETAVVPLSGYSAILEVQGSYGSKVNDCLITGTVSTIIAGGDMIIFEFVPSTLSAVRITEAYESSRVYQVKIISDTGSVAIPLTGEFILLKDLAP